ncbi:transcriptional Coactivator p15-domain-containing protein, partial [Protomyces lactucae-debilis]
KRAYTGKSTGASAKKQAVDEPIASWDLSELRRVQVKDFKGKTLVHIREFYRDKETDELKYGKTGIALTVEQWGKLSAICKEVDAVLKPEGKEQEEE